MRRMGFGQNDLTMRKAEYTTLLAVGMTWPPPLWRGSCAMTASRILNLTFLMAEGTRRLGYWLRSTDEEEHIFFGHNVSVHKVKHSGWEEVPTPDPIP